MSADIEGFQSWSEAVVRGCEALAPEHDAGWWRHAALKLAEKGSALVSELLESRRVPSQPPVTQGEQT